MLFPLILIYSKEKGKKNFNNNLGIRRVIIYFTIGLYITKNEQFSAFLHKSDTSVQYLLKYSTFDSVPIEVASMGFWCIY